MFYPESFYMDFLSFISPHLTSLKHVKNDQGLCIMKKPACANAKITIQIINIDQNSRETVQLNVCPGWPDLLV